MRPYLERFHANGKELITKSYFMFEQFLKKSAELVESGESFVVATVVRSIAPTSGKPGDKAIIRADGTLWGWIGGGCAQPVVIKEALKALSEKSSRFVRISSSPGGEEEGIVDYTMTCHSGGALDIYIEPVLPRPQILILGRSPVAQALSRLGTAIDYSVTVIAEKFNPENFGGARLLDKQVFSLSQMNPKAEDFVVVSTQGEADEEALEQALSSDAAYVAFVASRTKAEKVLEYLRARGMGKEKLERLRAPAGLKIGAASPQEIAVSILAEIVEVRSGAADNLPARESKKPALLPVIEHRDPVCGMMVDPAKTRHKSEYHGKTFFFCCAGCKQTFDKGPEKYLARRA